MLAIEHVEYSVPETYLDITESAAWLDVPVAHTKVFKKIYGLSKIPRVVDASMFEFLQKPIAKLLMRYQEDLSSIKYVIHTHTSQQLTPHGESLVLKLKNYFGLSNATAFATSLNNCASVLDALTIADLFLKDNPSQKILLIIGEIAFTPTIRLVPNISVTGDAAVAVMLSSTHENHRLMSLNVESFGRFASGLWMKENVRLEFEMQFPYLLKQSIDKTLANSPISLDQIKLVLPHNVNVRLWHEMAKVINVPKEKILTKNIPNYSHCFGADIFINYATAMNEKLLNLGDYYLMVTAGLGATIGTALFHY